MGTFFLGHPVLLFVLKYFIHPTLRRERLFRFQFQSLTCLLLGIYSIFSLREISFEILSPTPSSSCRWCPGSCSPPWADIGHWHLMSTCSSRDQGRSLPHIGGWTPGTLSPDPEQSWRHTADLDLACSEPWMFSRLHSEHWDPIQESQCRLFWMNPKNSESS